MDTQFQPASGDFKSALRTLVLLAVACGAAAAQQSNDQHPSPPPVSWVNPRIDARPGLQHFVLNSKSLGHEVGYVVWTPPGYDPDGEARYPVVYFLHGFGGNESSDGVGFSEIMKRAIQEGRLPKSIGVFPNGGQSGYRGEVERMIIKELIPRIDNDYRTQAHQSGRAIAGFSMGGQGAVRLSILHPELFCAAGSWGGGFRRGADEVLAAIDRNGQTLKQAGYAALLINGDQDHPNAYSRLVGRLDELGIDYEVVVLPDTKHNLGRYYGASGDEMMKFLSQQLSKSAD